MKTEIIVHSEQEKSTYGDLRDFLSSAIPRQIKRLSISKMPTKSSDELKCVQFFINFNNEESEEKSYYQLIGFNDGKLMEANKKIEILLDRYKSWYYFFRKYSLLLNLVIFGLAFSFSNIIYKIALSFVSKDNSFIIALILFFVVFGYIQKYIDREFPTYYFKMNETRRSTFWRITLASISIALIGNLLFYLFPYVMNWLGLN